MHINFTFNFNFNTRSGPNVFPYIRDSASSKIVFTNLNNAAPNTNVFAANSREHKIVDNGDGTITIFVQGSGVDRLYDSKERLVLVDY